MQQERAISLLGKFAEKSISGEEVFELQEWIQSADRSDIVEVMKRYEAFVMDASVNEPDQQLLIKIKQKIAALKDDEKTFRIFSMRRLTAAASILLVLSTGAYFLFFNVKQHQIAKIETPVQQDVEAPKGTKAVITLANGQAVALDSINSGTLATQGHVNVIKTADGKIIYTGTSDEMVYNTLTNPRGSNVVDITLADGSHVWLNAGSSVTYPVAFASNERIVEITGEAYFEITHDVAKKFLVEANGVTTEVIGTHFNINSYTDEQSIKVTLLEGSIKVATPQQSTVLKPGQQAQVNDRINIENVNTDDVMAWKNGMFIFKRSTIQDIMAQVARWYDVEVVFQGNILPKHYNGETSRNLKVSQMLKVLEESGIKFRIEGRKIVMTN